MDEEQVHLLSELPQLLAAEGVPLEEAQQRIERVLQDVYAIIGALPGQRLQPAS